MKKTTLIVCTFLLACLVIIHTTGLYAQLPATDCKVALAELEGSYNGDCRNGLAHGKGEAKGRHHYLGQFKNGRPNGQGTYYYNDSVYHVGIFQDGLREGKGITYYTRAGKPDSLVKGYWSGDVYRGKRYSTYVVNDMPVFDRSEITSSDERGNTITIETETTSGAIKGSNVTTGTGLVLTVSDVVALDGSFIKKLDETSGIKYKVSYELSKFPVRLRIMLSNGQSFTLELYKPAKWNVYLFLNK
jgi:hypothetical protein